MNYINLQTEQLMYTIYISCNVAQSKCIGETHLNNMYTALWLML